MVGAGKAEESFSVSSRRSWLERLPGWTKQLAAIGVLPEDAEGEPIRKASLILTASMITGMAVIWVVTRSAVLRRYALLPTSSAFVFASPCMRARSI